MKTLLISVSYFSLMKYFAYFLVVSVCLNLPIWTIGIGMVSIVIINLAKAIVMLRQKRISEILSRRR